MNNSKQPIKIIMLATASDLTNIIYTRLSKEFTISKIIIEKNISKKIILKNRIKKLGFFNVAGQLLFLLFITKTLHFFSTKRKNEILKQFNLSEENIPSEKITSVDSINNSTTISILQKEKPDLIIVNGTRIISSEVINSGNARFINIHAGITPLYRGVHGGYWAIAMKDKKNCGVTIHFIDKGIDTGGILAQGIIEPTKKDNFATYPYLQFAKGAELFTEVIHKFENETLQEKSAPKGQSKLWYHPTLWQYLYYRATNGAK